MGDYAAEAIDKIRAQVGNDEVILGLSGGVDSSVAAALIHRAIGDQLTCVFVDTGLLRLGEESAGDRHVWKHMGIKLVHVDASDRFMTALAGETDPEAKRKIIGREFVHVFQEEAAKLPARQVARARNHLSRRDRVSRGKDEEGDDDQESPQRRRPSRDTASETA